MRYTLLSVLLLVGILSVHAISNNTVEIVYTGNTATVTVASNISSYVSVSSGNSSHVVITQSASFAGINPTVSNTDGEITYSLSGTSTNGSLYLEGAFKCIVELNGVTLTNPSGPAINIQNGKRVEVSVKKGTTSTLTDGANEDYNGCLHCKGHTKLKGKGTLNVTGNNRHAIYSKEYLEIKNCTINVDKAVKDAIHCKEYFLMESGVVNLRNAGDDAIQVELESDSPTTGETTDHEEENSGHFYMTDGTLTISAYAGKAIKTDGLIYYRGGTQNFNTSDTEVTADIPTLSVPLHHRANGIYDLQGRRLTAKPQRSSIYIIVRDGQVRKLFSR